MPYSKYTNKDCDKCAVCQYEYKEKEKVKKLRCGHLFHIDCINTWLEDNSAGYRRRKNRIATQNSYYKAVLEYVVLLINKANK